MIGRGAPRPWALCVYGLRPGLVTSREVSVLFVFFFLLLSSCFCSYEVLPAVVCFV